MANVGDFTWQFPTEAGRETVDSLIDGILSKAGPTTLVVMTSNLAEVIQAAKIAPAEHAAPLKGGRLSPLWGASVSPACCKVSLDRSLIPTAFVANLFRVRRGSPSPDPAVRPGRGLQVTRRRSGSRAPETTSGPGAVCMPLALSMDDHVPIATRRGFGRSVPEGTIG